MSIDHHSASASDITIKRFEPDCIIRARSGEVDLACVFDTLFEQVLWGRVNSDHHMTCINVCHERRAPLYAMEQDDQRPSHREQRGKSAYHRGKRINDACTPSVASVSEILVDWGQIIVTPRVLPATAVRISAVVAAERTDLYAP